MGKKKLNWREIGIDKLVIMFLCGIFLLVLSWPSGSAEEKKTEKEAVAVTESDGKSESEEYTQTLEKKLEDMLSKLEGIKKVQVMITLKTSAEKVTLKDNPYSQETTTQKDQNSESTSHQMTGEETTVLVETEEGSQPYVVKEKEPQVEGVLILVEGLENTALKNEISEAAEALFGVPLHKIKVMKMKVEE